MTQTLTMYTTGGPVEVPATIRGVREALPAELRATFTAEAETTAVGDLPMLLARWLMKAPTGYEAEEDALVARVREGDFTGVTFPDDLTDEYRSAG
ncbi:hypothetical protein ABT354_22970 [Streptomyces sp. NPDC000594]|uniref:hypothetical protein n=1 Tax=Streptomyces sp. NPDC000594 TaxID=3154261 RepID=UPI00332DC586